MQIFKAESRPAVDQQQTQSIWSLCKFDIPTTIWGREESCVSLQGADLMGVHAQEHCTFVFSRIEVARSVPLSTLYEKKYFRAPFLVLQVVTNRGPGRTK